MRDLPDLGMIWEFYDESDLVFPLVERLWLPCILQWWSIRGALGVKGGAICSCLSGEWMEFPRAVSGKICVEIAGASSTLARLLR